MSNSQIKNKVKSYKAMSFLFEDNKGKEYYSKIFYFGLRKLDLKRKAEVMEEISPDKKRPRLNLKRKNPFHNGNERKIKKLSFDLWK